MLPEACYTGYLTGTELAKAYASSDLFVFPSTTDTFGNVIIEALASGTAQEAFAAARRENALSGASLGDSL